MVQAHYIIKAAQQKQELLHEAEALVAAITQAEREAAALQVAANQMHASNAEVSHKFR